MPRAAVALLLLLPSTPAHAQEPEKKVVVTASPLDPRDLFDVPYSMDLVLRQDIDRGMFRTAPEALKEVPGVNVQKTSNGQGSPFIRGFTGFRNVLLIDGIRLNHAAFRDGPNQYGSTVDSFLIDRMEILRGPAAVLYGSDAMGGTVAVSTRTWDRLPAEREWSSRAYGRYAGAEDSTTERLEWTAASPSWAVAAGLTVRDYNDIVGGRHTGEQSNSGYDEYDADAKVQIDLGFRRTLWIAAQRTRVDDAARTHSTNVSKEWHGTATGTDRRRDSDQERDLVYVQFAWEEMGTFADSMFLSLALHRQGEDSNRITSSGAREFREFTVSTPSLIGKFSRKTGAGRLTFGAEVYRDKVSSGGFNRSAAGVLTGFDRGEVADDSTVLLLGAFVQDDLELADRFDLAAGLRFTTEKIDAGNVDPGGLGGPNLGSFVETYSNVAGSARLLYRASEDLHLVAGLSQGFRAPNLDDTTAVRLVLSGQTDFPNPDLDPETSLTFELGARARSGPVSGQIFVFQTLLSDFIARVPAPAIGPTAFTKENFADGFVRGIEAGLRWGFDPAWTFWVDFSAYVGEVDAFVGTEEKKQPLPKMNPATIRFGARWQPAKKGPWAEAVVTGVHAQEHLSPSDEADTQRIPPGGTPGFSVVTLRGGLPLAERVHGTLSIENLADRDYRWHGSGTNEPGTNVIVGIDARF